MKLLILAAAVLAAMLAGSATAGADPTPSPGPYQIITPNGPVLGGIPTLPSVCAVQPRACALTWDPNTGAWERPGTDSP
jgi:hypothetical protein